MIIVLYSSSRNQNMSGRCLHARSLSLAYFKMFPFAQVACLYLACNLAYFAVLDGSAVEASRAVAVDVSNALGFSVLGKAAVAGGVALSTLGSCNGSILTGGRLFFAVARDGEEEVATAQDARAHRHGERDDGERGGLEGGPSTGASGGGGEGVERGVIRQPTPGDGHGCGGGSGGWGRDDDAPRPALLPRWCGVLNGNGAPANALAAQVTPLQIPRVNTAAPLLQRITCLHVLVQGSRLCRLFGCARFSRPLFRASRVCFLCGGAIF